MDVNTSYALELTTKVSEDMARALEMMRNIPKPQGPKGAVFIRVSPLMYDWLKKRSAIWVPGPSDIGNPSLYGMPFAIEPRQEPIPLTYWDEQGRFVGFATLAEVEGYDGECLAIAEFKDDSLSRTMTVEKFLGSMGT